MAITKPFLFQNTCNKAYNVCAHYWHGISPADCHRAFVAGKSIGVFNILMFFSCFPFIIQL